MCQLTRKETEYITCQKCGRLFPKTQARKPCYHCTRMLGFHRRTGAVCSVCAVELAKCEDCLQSFCQEHERPESHVRHQGANTRDTCAKRTECLERVSGSGR